MIFVEQIDRIERNLSELQKDLTEELKTLPEGKFYYNEARGYKNYYQRLPKAGNRKKEQRLGVSGDSECLRGLVRKEYVVQALKAIEGNLKLLDGLAGKFSPVDENSIMESFTEKHPELQEMIYGFGSEEGGDERQEQDIFYEENLKSTAADGSRRRSLAEIIIGSRLTHYGISYKYEAPIPHPDLKGRFRPDFTIRRPRDGKIIYWEHLGKVDDQDYLEYNKYKFDTYERYGIVPWDNLIVSFSKKDQGIDEKLIDCLIKGWLL